MSATITKSRTGSHYQRSAFYGVIALCMATSACSSQHQGQHQGGGLTATANELAAEQYAVQGENALKSQGIEAADPMFTKALALNNANRRAGFYSAVTAPLVALKGFFPRVAPLLDPKAKLSALKLAEPLGFIGQPGDLKAFGTLHELQRFMRTALLPLLLESAAKLERISSEQPLELSHAVIEPSDLKMIRGAVMAIVDTIRLKTAYSLEGAEEIKRDLRNRNTREVVELLFEHRGFLKLENDHQLGALDRSGDEVLHHAMDLATAQAELCPKALGKSCEGAGLVHRFISAIGSGLDLLAGPTEIEMGTQKILIDVTRLLNDSPKDLKDYLPTHFDQRGEALSVPDKTMGGLFPRGDMIEKLKKLAK